MPTNRWHKQLLTRTLNYSICNIRSLILVIIIYFMMLILIEYLKATPLAVHVISERGLGLGVLKNMIVYAFLPFILLISVFLISLLSRSIILGSLAFLSLVYYFGEKSLFSMPLKEYSELFFIIMLIAFLGITAFTYIISQFTGGYLDSVTRAMRYRDNRAIATSLALSALSIEIIVHLNYWPQNIIGSFFRLLSIALTVFGLFYLNNSLGSILMSIFSALGWPITFLTYVLLSSQPTIQRKKYLREKKILHMDHLKVLGVSTRTTAFRNLLKTTAFRWSLRGVQCSKPTKPSISLDSKIIFHVYGENARRALIPLFNKLNTRVLCLGCKESFWKNIEEPFHITADNIGLIETKKPKVVFIDSPEDYAYAAVVALTGIIESEEVIIIDGMESLFFNTKLLRAVIKELLNSFKVIIVISDYLDYYILSDHVFRFPSIETLYLIGHAKNIRVLKELLKDYLDFHVINNMLEDMSKGKYLILFPVDSKLLLVSFSENT